MMRNSGGRSVIDLPGLFVAFMAGFAEVGVAMMDRVGDWLSDVETSGEISDSGLAARLNIVLICCEVMKV